MLSRILQIASLFQPLTYFASGNKHTSGNLDPYPDPIYFEHLPLVDTEVHRLFREHQDADEDQHLYAASAMFILQPGLQDSVREFEGPYTLSVAKGAVEFTLLRDNDAKVWIKTDPSADPVVVKPTDEMPITLGFRMSLSTNGRIDAQFSYAGENDENTHLHGMNFYDEIGDEGGCKGACW